jgi:hypothetical protein
MSKALDELRARLLDLEADFHFVSLATRLRPRLGDVMNWGAAGEVTALAREFMSSKGSRVEGVFGPLLVRLLAALERYTRSLIEEALVAHARRAVTYDQLAPQIRTRNTALTGTLLASIESPRDHLKLHFDSLINNLASCQPGSTAYHLNVQAFGAAVAGMGAATLEKALANVGVRDWWDKLGADSALARVLGTKGSRATGKVARDRLEELWRWRNHLAHGGDEEVALSESQLRECVAFVRTLAAALDSVVLGSVKAGAA